MKELCDVTGYTHSGIQHHNEGRNREHFDCQRGGRILADASDGTEFSVGVCEVWQKSTYWGYLRAILEEVWKSVQHIPAM